MATKQQVATNAWNKAVYYFEERAPTDPIVALHWYELLRWAEKSRDNRQDRSPRQKEMQLLWQEAGQIGWAIANVRATIKALKRMGIHTSANYLRKMSWELEQAKVYNKQAMLTVKQRIP